MARRRGTEIMVTLAATATAARLLERGWVARFTHQFSSMAIRRGIRDGSRTWMYAGAIATTAHYLQRFVGKQEEVHRIKLRRGEAVEIREIPRAKRRA